MFLAVWLGWALKKGFYTARAARTDSYRAANSLLRMALDGKICLCLRPPGYSSEKGKIHNCIESLNLFLGKGFYSAYE
jgi:hypothetical protein